MWREDQQVATSFQLDPGDPLSYVFYTDNAAQRPQLWRRRRPASWQALPSLTLGATLGLLQTEYIGYSYGDRDLDGRAQAHAPEYQYSLVRAVGRRPGLDGARRPERQRRHFISMRATTSARSPTRC